MTWRKTKLYNDFGLHANTLQWMHLQVVIVEIWEIILWKPGMETQLVQLKNLQQLLSSQ